MTNCIACGLPVEDGHAWAELTFHGLHALSLNGVAIRAHARCIRIEATPASEFPEPVANDPAGELVRAGAAA